MEKWEICQSKSVLETAFFRVRQDACRLPNGREIDDFYVIENPNVVMIIARTLEGDFLMVEQYKHGAGEICLEIVGGLIDAEDENPLSAAKRELREETGYEAYQWIQLAIYRSDPTRTNNRIFIFLALDAFKVGEQALDANEEIRVHELSQTELLDKIRSGAINVAISVAGLMMAFDYLK